MSLPAQFASSKVGSVGRGSSNVEKKSLRASRSCIGTNSQERDAARSFILALKSCSGRSGLEHGRRIHAQIMQTGLDRSNMYVVSSLVNMYVRCGSVAEAQRAFDKMPHRNEFTWTGIIFAHVRNGDGASALKLFQAMQAEGFKATPLIYAAALKACTILAAQEWDEGGKYVRGEALKTGLSIAERLISTWGKAAFSVASSLIAMYAACGRMQQALEIFRQVPDQDLGLLNALMLGYAGNGAGEEALKLFVIMQSSGKNYAPDSRTFVAALKACSVLAAQEAGSKMDGSIVKLKALEKGMAIHTQAAKAGLDISQEHVGNALISMYATCGSIEDAKKVFDRMQHQTAISWNTLIKGYLENGLDEVALELFVLMHSQGVQPTPPAYICAFQACSSITEEHENNEGLSLQLIVLEKVMSIHAHAARNLKTSGMFLASSMVRAYGMCGSMVDARMIFDRMTSRTLVTWNAILSGYVKNGEPEEALKLLNYMVSSGCLPEAWAFGTAIKACRLLAEKEECRLLDEKLVKLEALEKGMAIHSQMRRHEDLFVQSSLVDMYSKCRSMQDAKMVFDRVQKRDAALWTALLLGYVENEQPEEALELIIDMKSEGLGCCSATLSAALKVCGGAAAMQIGKAIHGELCRYGFECYPAVITSLLDFYGRCGDMTTAQTIFDSMNADTADFRHWTVLMKGYSRAVDFDKIDQLLQRMLDRNLKPDGVMFLAILSACSHAGLVEKGLKCLEVMQSRFGVCPEAKHFNCVVDSLGRANRLDEAVAMVESMPFEPSVLSWMTILSGCSKWNNADVGKKAFDQVILLNEKYEPAYQVMANIYASAGMWEERSLIYSKWATIQL